jgi:hypothetical protein
MTVSLFTGKLKLVADTRRLKVDAKGFTVKSEKTLYP